MNKRQAEDAGYTFTGVYSFNKEEVKLRAKEERKFGNKAMIVFIPGTRSDGWSCYHIVSDENKKKAKIESLRSKISTLNTKKVLLIDEMSRIDKELIDINNELMGWINEQN